MRWWKTSHFRLQIKRSVRDFSLGSREYQGAQLPLASSVYPFDFTAVYPWYFPCAPRRSSCLLCSKSFLRTESYFSLVETMKNEHMCSPFKTVDKTQERVSLHAAFASMFYRIPFLLRISFFWNSQEEVNINTISYYIYLSIGSILYLWRDKLRAERHRSLLPFLV